MIDKRLLLAALLTASAYLLLRGESRDNDTSESDNAPSIFDEITNTAGDYWMNVSSNGGNRAAFLSMLRVPEGTSGPDGYRTLVGGALFDSYATHPALAGWRGLPLSTAMCAGAGLGPGCVSTAAGAYQITKPTYVRVAAKLGITDFSPESQDAIALELANEKGALSDIDAGNLESAIAKVRRVWASLPGAGYGQREASMQALLDVFQQAGGVLA